MGAFFWKTRSCTKAQTWQAQQEPYFSPNQQEALYKAQTAQLPFTTALVSSFQPSVLCLWWLPLTHPYHSGFLVLSPKSPLMFHLACWPPTHKPRPHCIEDSWITAPSSDPVTQPWLQQKRKGRGQNSQLYKLIFIKGDNVRSGETVYTIL